APQSHYREGHRSARTRRHLAPACAGCPAPAVAARSTCDGLPSLTPPRTLRAVGDRAPAPTPTAPGPRHSPGPGIDGPRRSDPRRSPRPDRSATAVGVRSVGGLYGGDAGHFSGTSYGHINGIASFSTGDTEQHTAGLAGCVALGNGDCG